MSASGLQPAINDASDVDDGLGRGFGEAPSPPAVGGSCAPSALGVLGCHDEPPLCHFLGCCAPSTGRGQATFPSCPIARPRSPPTTPCCAAADAPRPALGCPPAVLDRPSSPACRNLGVPSGADAAILAALPVRTPAARPSSALAALASGERRLRPLPLLYGRALGAVVRVQQHSGLLDSQERASRCSLSTIPPVPGRLRSRGR